MRKRIAVFIDVDNTSVEYSEYLSVLSQISLEGTIAYGKLYGVSERRNREIIDHAAEAGYETALAPRIKRRVKGFDNRLLIDIIELIATNKTFDSVAVISYPTDFVPLFSKLRGYGIEIIALDNIDKPCVNMCDILISLKSGEREEEDGADEVNALGELGRLPCSAVDTVDEGVSFNEMIVNTYGKGGLDGDITSISFDDGSDADTAGVENSPLFDVLNEDDLGEDDLGEDDLNEDGLNGDDLNGENGEDLNVLMERVKKVLVEIKDENT